MLEGSSFLWIDLCVALTKIFMKSEKPKTDWFNFISTVIVISSLYGLSKIKSVSYLIDDVPSESSLMKDLKFGVQFLLVTYCTSIKAPLNKLTHLKSYYSSILI